MKRLFVLCAVLCMAIGLSAQTQTVAYFSFNGLQGQPNTATVVSADGGLQSGTAALYMDGTNGSSAWNATSELNSFSGNAINLMDGFANGQDLALVGNDANGKSVVFKLSFTGFQDLVITYAFRRTASGFNSCVWSYSIDGVNFTTAVTKSYTSSDPVGTYFAESADLSSVSAIDNQGDIYIRLTVDGATNGSGNIRMDNVQFNAYPEGPDVYGPYVTNAVAISSNTIQLTFNEDLDNTTASNPANYTLDNNYTVSDASVYSNMVTLTATPSFVNGVPFNLFVQNVADASGNVMDPDTFTLVYGILDEYLCADIATLRSKLDFTGNSGSVQDTVEYKLTGNVIVTAVAAYNNQKVLQDETGAILVYDQANILGSLDVADEISGIYCKLTNYWGFLELVPTRPYETFVDYFQDVDPMVVTLSQLNDNDYMIEHQAELIQLDNVTITSAGNFAKLNRYDLSQSGVTAPALFPYFQDVNYLGMEIPTGVEQSIIGFNFATSKIGNSNFDFRYYIVPRFSNDMSAMTSVQDYGRLQVSVYPNPTSGFVRWDNCDATYAEIYDIDGKMVASQSVSSDNTVSLQSLSAGSYFLRLLNNGEVVGTAKIIKR